MLDSCKFTFCTFKIVTSQIWICRFTFWTWEVAIHVSHTFTFWISRFRFKFNRGSKSQPLDRNSQLAALDFVDMFWGSIFVLNWEKTFDLLNSMKKNQMQWQIISSKSFVFIAYSNIYHLPKNCKIILKINLGLF